MWASILIAAAWSLYPFLSGTARSPVLRQGRHFPGNVGLALVAVLVVAGGGRFWGGLDRLFWHKYFPTQIPPKPPMKGTGKRED